MEGNQTACLQETMSQFQLSVGLDLLGESPLSFIWCPLCLYVPSQSVNLQH